MSITSEQNGEQGFAVTRFKMLNDNEGVRSPIQNVIFLLDTSGSMTGERIERLNIAMTEIVREIKELARQMEIQIKMRVIQFSSVAYWIFGDTEHGVEHIDWIPLVAGGTTDTAGAINLARSVMHRQFLGERNYRPVVILVTDGQSNDPTKTRDAIASLKYSLKSSNNYSKDKIIRIAIGIGDAPDPSELAEFASIGDIESDEGLEENVPLVFNVDDINLLESLLLGVTINSIMTSIRLYFGGECVKEDNFEIYLDLSEEDSDWEE